jgi:hypothetical protein
MIVENPLALAYLLPGDVFILRDEKPLLLNTLPVEHVTIQSEIAGPTIQVQEPEITYVEPALVAEQPAAPAIPSIPKITQPAAIETPAAAFNYMGGFGQKFLVIVSYPDYDVMEPAHLNALESTIKRKEMSLDDVAIFNIGKYPGTDIKAIGRFFKPKRMLLLGKESFPQALAEPVFNQLTTLGTCQLLSSYSFNEMMGDKALVKAFWEQMKML